MDGTIPNNIVNVPVQHQIANPINNAKFVTTTVNVNHASTNHVTNVNGQNLNLIKPNMIQLSANTDHLGQVITLTRINDLVRDVDPTLQLEEEVEDTLLAIADEFIDKLINGSCMMAKHRHVPSVEVKDIQLYLERNCNMWLPGFGTDELRPYKRSSVTEAHKQRLALIRRALKKY